MGPIARFARFALRALFWPWNIVLTALALLGYVPLALVDLFVDAADGLARWDFVFGSVVMVAVPPLTLAYAWVHRQHLKDDPAELAVLFFGVELPLLAITAARLFGFQQLTGTAQLVYVAIVFGGLVAEGRLVLGKRMPGGQLVDGLAHGLLVMRAVAGAYVGVLLATLSLPALVNIAVDVTDAVFAGAAGVLVGAIVLAPVTLFVVASVVLLLTLPVTAPVVWLHALVRSGRELQAKWGWDDVFFASAAPVVVFVAGFFLMLPQPHVAAFEALANLPTTDDERRALVAQQDDIALGLLDAYLGKHHYVADDDNDLWAEVLTLQGKLMPHHQLRDVDVALNEAARPFTYVGRLPDEQRAAQLYRDFFGRELERDHAPAVRDALAATWSREARFAGFINEGEQRVRLERQDVVVDAHDGVFDVEIHDEWVNQTANDEEVALFFELPETAAVRGLWLSPTSNKADGAAHVTAPRGAAQQLYNEEVRAKRDPALLEQVGPQQYRLRVFPVPARPPRVRETSVASVLSGAETWAGPTSPRVHVWVAYQTLPDADGHAPLPHLRERRNGFWDAHAIRTINGDAIDAVDAVDRTDGGAGSGWVQGASTLRTTPIALSIGLGAASGTSGCVRFTPSPAPSPMWSGKRIDVVVDRSLQLAAHRPQLIHALELLQDSGATLRFVLGTSALRGEPAKILADGAVVDVDQLVFFGAARPKELLRQLLELRGASLGDAVVVLASGGSFDVADDSALDLSRLPDQKLPPTLLVHVTGAMPAGYDDATLDAIRRSGGTATDDIAAALARLSPQTFADGYRIDVVDSACADVAGLLPVAARQRILMADRGGMAALDTLDGLHRLAVSASVVTPYSSMIVLLNEQQRARLAQLNAQQDRFDREVEEDAKATGGAKADGKAVVVPPSSPEPQKLEQNAARAPATGVVAAGAPAPESVMNAKEAPSLMAKTSSLADAVSEAQSPPVATTTAPQPVPQVSGVPEPEEWLLVILACAAVGFFELRRRRMLR